MNKNAELFFSGELPERFDGAFAALSERLGFVRAEGGFPVHVCRGTKGLSVVRTPEKAEISYSKPVQLYRALSLLSEHWQESAFSIEETPCFETVGMMLDVSRNAVLKPEALRGILEKMSLMGLNLGMMYTEDTYEIPEQPYFGWMRGRYSIEELRALDDYADLLGIELCPCIQTLGHLNRALHWPALAHLKDNEEVLLADEEKTYEFLEKAIAAAVAPYRSRRIHIGMDEAHGIGLGQHLRRFGYEDPHTIIRRHLDRVLEITGRLNLDVMMWSDMYFRPDSPTDGYYDSGEPTEKTCACVRPDVTLVYWDYYHQKRSEYEEMLKKHRKLGAPVAFAGGIWTWTGPATDYRKTIATTVPALEAARDAGVPLVLATAWGDNGAEANLQTALPGMQIYAEFNYTGHYDEQELTRRFKTCCGGDFRMFQDLNGFNEVPGMLSGSLRPVNAAKFMLYQDPLVQLYEEDTKGIDMAGHFAQLEKTYAEYAAKGDEYSQLMGFYEQLARVLAAKCRWHQEIGPAVRRQDRAAAAELAASLEQLEQETERLRICWRALWNSTNRTFGFEILDGRLGAVRARLETAREAVDNWVNGGPAPEELLQPTLPYIRMADGTLFGSYAVGEIVSACKINN